MIVSRAPRTAALVPFVEVLWVHRAELAHAFERLLPNGRMQILVNLDEDALRDYTLDGRAQAVTSGAALGGARASPIVIDTREQRAICGVSFAPGGARPFFEAPASETFEQTVALDVLWGRDGARLRERLLDTADPHAQLDVLEAALLARARRGLASDRAFEAARRMLAGGSPVGSVERELGLSPRLLIERFRAHTGMTPKTFARIERFQHLVRAIDGTRGFADLAAAHGFSDQAHMIREFKALSGTTPAAYRARSHEDRNHSALEGALDEA